MENFDFGSFINSPVAVGEDARPWGDGSTANGPPAAENLQRSTSFNAGIQGAQVTAAAMFASPSQRTPLHRSSTDFGDFASNAFAQNNAPPWTESVHGIQPFVNHDANFEGPTFGSQDVNYSRHIPSGPSMEATVPAPLAAAVASSQRDPATAMNEVAPLPTDYRSSIAAHHSSQLKQWFPALLQTSQTSLGGPGRTAFGMHSSPSVPLSQAMRMTAPSQRHATGQGKAERPSLTIQERRRLSRRRSAAASKSSSGSTSSASASSYAAKRDAEKRLGPHESLHREAAQATARSMSQLMQPSLSQPQSPSPNGMALEPSPPSSNSDPVFTGDFGDVIENKRTQSNLYASTGFDLIGALTRIANRPNPKITIGPIDLSCSFTVSDANMPDQPILYCSDSFLHLTGYERAEVLGRNCRFLQAPGGMVEAGSERQHTDGRAARHLKRRCQNFQECQATLINYRKNGHPFINLVTIVPLSWGDVGPDGEPPPTYLIGFQVDLVESPGAVVERKADGTYHMNYANGDRQDPTRSQPLDDHTALHTHAAETLAAAAASAVAQQDPAVVKANQQRMMAKDLAEIISSGSVDTSQWATLLLENSHDLIHVLSLKGTFLYVSPSVERILGFKPEELVGKSISEFCHPSDVVPVFRELKDSTSNASIAAAARHSARTDGTVNPLTKGGAGQVGPSVNLMMRMRHKTLGHTWIESAGKLHLEQGKGRKVVISSGRTRPVYDLPWEMARSSLDPPGHDSPGVWSKVSKSGLFLTTNGAISNLLGQQAEDTQLTGRHIRRFTNPEAHSAILTALQSSDGGVVSHAMNDGHSSPQVDVLSTFYPSTQDSEVAEQQPAVFVHTQRLNGRMPSLVPNHLFSLAGVESRAHIAPFDKHSSSEQDTVSTLKPGEPRAGSVFAELSTYRSSSWVFELHQLKNANKKLREELRHRRRDSRAQPTGMTPSHRSSAGDSLQRPPLNVNPVFKSQRAVEGGKESSGSGGETSSSSAVQSSNDSLLPSTSSSEETVATSGVSAGEEVNPSVSGIKRKF
ncbi:hypothetical protein CBOM_03443 [Ceraceosorus bombacis]|uniref:PAS domain-containing protein n=1 Tax=Ceraceosorus bombacis TaxID=401625 RepID=A0A0P1BM35_9BASI|nr:hypothetical protein CBOM_03443 [Ceraceosorus bombacis]